MYHGEENRSGRGGGVQSRRGEYKLMLACVVINILIVLILILIIVVVVAIIVANIAVAITVITAVNVITAVTAVTVTYICFGFLIITRGAWRGARPAGR
mmetsp:Transcript_18686/g.46539  ORF Transcript_18686/g.46539 Transcript_18686/m.46539 type:complete len:99 (+) Transcript_18686:192-488(+)